MVKPRVPLRTSDARRSGIAVVDPIADLKRRLGREATARSRAYWTGFQRVGSTCVLRPVAPVSRAAAPRATSRPLHLLPRASRGVAMPKVRTCVQRWWREHGLDEDAPAIGKRIALVLLEDPTPEAKLAGIVVLHDLLGTQLRPSDLPAFARLFVQGHLADATVVDWFATKVLCGLLDREPGRAEVARALVQWRSAETTWQRRAACLAFVGLAPQGDAALPGLAELVLAICATVVWSHESFDQTAVGWALRELSSADPAAVEAFFRRHALLMSKECARQAVAKLPPAARAELLEYHRRATSLRA